MGRRKIFIEELNTFGEEIDVILTVSNAEHFLSVWDIAALERILEAQIKSENYEVVELIRKMIFEKATRIYEG